MYVEVGADRLQVVVAVAFWARFAFVFEKIHFHVNVWFY